MINLTEDMKAELLETLSDMRMINRMIGNGTPMDIYDVQNGLRNVAWGVHNIITALVCGDNDDADASEVLAERGTFG